MLPYKVSKAPFCNAFGDDPYIYKDLAKKSSLPSDLKEICPLQGNFTIDGAVFPLEEAPRNAFQSADIMAEFIFFKG